MSHRADYPDDFLLGAANRPGVGTHWLVDVPRIDPPEGRPRFPWVKVSLLAAAVAAALLAISLL